MDLSTINNETVGIGSLVVAAGVALWKRTVVTQTAIDGVLYIRSMNEELYKCTWPWDPNLEPTDLKKYRELIGNTVAVILATLLLAAFVSASDFLIHPAVALFANGGLK